MRNFRIIHYPIVYASPCILMHYECENELRSILEKSGKKPRFKAAFKARLDFLVQHWAIAPTLHHQWFEVLLGKQGISSMKFINIDNIRILYILKGNTAFLLYAFKETSTATSDDPKSYKHACEIASTRIVDIEEV